MKELKEKLAECGFFQFSLFFGNANLRYKDWELAVGSLNPPLKSFVELFLLQYPYPVEAARDLVGEPTLQRLIAAEILVQEDSSVRSNHFFLLTAFSNAYFAQVSANPFAYFGEDSLALATYQTPVANADVLDLCAGPGIQSLVAASRAKSVTAVELRPNAAAVAAVNVEINEREDKIQIVNSSLEDFAAKNRNSYDQILFNPPLVPVPEEMEYHIAGHGGVVGLDVIKTIFDLYKSTLKPGGKMDFIGMTMNSSEKPESEEPLRALIREYGFEGRLHILSRHHLNRNSMVLDALVNTLAQENQVTQTVAMDRCLEFYHRLGYDQSYLYFCSIAPSDSKEPELEVVDMSQTHYGGWFS